MSESKRSHYGLKQVKRSLFHFVLGKGVAAASTFAVLVISVRHLSTEEFAVYTSMHAMVLMVGLLSSFGTNAVLMRFLPELRSQGNVRGMYQLLFYGISARGGSYALIAIVLALLAVPICNALHIPDWVNIVRWYCLVGFLRINQTFVSGALESLLWQRMTQGSAAISGIVKLVIVMVVIHQRGGLDLVTFVAIETCTEALILMMLVGGAVRRWYRDPERNAGDPDIVKKNRERFNKFAFWNYMQNLTMIGYGSAPNRLFATYFLSRELVAAFGVIDRFIDYIRRYEPLRIFVGLVRPVFNSRFSESGDFQRIVRMANFLFRIDLFILIAPMVVLAVAGEQVFHWLTSGKYTGISALFLAFYVTAIIASVDSILDILVKVIEETRIYTVSNLALSASIALAIPLIPHVGLWALAAANGAGLLISFTIIIHYVKSRGHPIRPDWDLIARVIGYALCGIAVGQALLRLAAAPPWLAASCAEITFFALTAVFPPLRPEEKKLLRSLRTSGLSGLKRR